MISIIIQGFEKDCFDNCLYKQRTEIERLSPFFKELVRHNEEMITLIEEEPSDAFTFLDEILQNKGKVVDASNKWNFYWAKLSIKWQIAEFIVYYANKINIHIEKLLVSDSVEVLGSTGALATAINGIYDSFRESSVSRPAYKKSNPDSSEDILLEYNGIKKIWTIKSMDRSRTNTAGAYADCDSFTTPDKVKSYWKIWNHNRWEYDSNIKVKAIAKKTNISEQDLLMLWEMLELRFKFSFPQLDSFLVNNISDLLWVLVNHKELWKEDSMKSILTTDDWCSLSMKLSSNQK